MEIDINLTKEDWVKYNQYLSKRFKSIVNKNTFFKDMVPWFFWGLIATSAMNFLDEEIHWPTCILTTMIFVLIGLCATRKSKKAQDLMMPSSDGVFIGSHHFKFDELGIHSSGTKYNSNMQWSAVKNIEFSDDYILIFIDTVQAYIIPTNQIESITELKDILTKYSKLT